jgi:hypothetical protein
MTVPIEDTTDEHRHDAELEAALAWHDGDLSATIRALLEDCRHLREQLALTNGAVSRGLVRGWEPSFERLDG